MSKRAGASEAYNRAENMKTQGRRGCKTDRINLAITPTNLEYIQIKSKCEGTHYSNIINHCIDAERLRENA